MTRAIRAYARATGFDLCGIAPVEAALHADFFELWLAQGRAGEMTYLQRHVEKRRNPLLLTAKGAAPFRSVVVLAVNYHQLDLPPSVRDDPSRGVLASYAWSYDYHEIIRSRLYEIDRFIRDGTGRASLGKCLVDTGPVLERDWAMRAGIGFTGKNCCTIHPVHGSWLFLATIWVPERLTYTAAPSPISATSATLPAREICEGLPAADDYGHWDIRLQMTSPDDDGATRVGACGKCIRCLQACPTGAFVGPYHLDPLRCISYWTIEAREPIPRSLRPNFGNRIFGCDICQEVCPWNRRLGQRAPLIEALRFQRHRLAAPLLEGFRADSPYWLQEGAFAVHFRRSPVLRARRHGMLRNVCVALGNWASLETLPALAVALDDEEPLVRGHAAWALGCVAAAHGDTRVAKRLSDAQSSEPVEWVREEIALALAGTND